jgi:4-amino-4-deoxy-L-arabinose transferase-like glycosyltransferase
MIRDRTWRSSPALFFFCWVAFPMFFFSASQSKLPGYILPVIPPLALLTARSFVLAAERKHPLARWLPLGLGATLLAMSVMASLRLTRLFSEQPPALRLDANAAIILLLSAGILIIFATLLRNLFLASLAVCLAVVMVLQGTLIWGAPLADPHVSIRRTAQAVQPAADTVKSYRLHRAWQHGLEYYLNREVPEWDPAQAPPPFLVTSRAALGELRRQGVRAVVVHSFSRQALVTVIRREPPSEPAPRGPAVP